jgi:hypothetical protein
MKPVRGVFGLLGRNAQFLLLGIGKRFQNAGGLLSMLRGARMSGVLGK